MIAAAKLTLAGACALSVAACTPSDPLGPGPAQLTGTVVGGVAGGLLGNSVGRGAGRAFATLAGIAVGALAGSHLGHLLDERDRDAAYDAAQTAFESGKPQRWSNRRSGHRGVIEAQPPFIDANGRTCRRFTHTVRIDREKEVIRGKACRLYDGSWHIVA